MKPVPGVCGVDEAGRGPLAGAVFAAAVILDVAEPIEGLADSKTLSAHARQRLSDEIRGRSLAWSIAVATVEEVDRLNILRATMLAMQRAVNSLAIKPIEVLVDGNRCPELDYPTRAIVKGDVTERTISAASILAKVERDAHMLELHEQYPCYGFDRHKGYPTRQHLQALRQFGASPVHRRSFSPVRDLICCESGG